MERVLDDLDRIFNLSPDLIAFAGFDGNWKRVNPAFATVLGFTPSEVVGRSFLEFVHPDDRDRSAAAAGDLAAGKNLLAFEVRILCADGSYRWIEWDSAAILEDKLFCAIGRDMTDRHRAEAELGQLADEQAALLRVAMLVAEGAPAGRLFEAVVREAGALLGADLAGLTRFEEDSALIVGLWSVDGEHPDVPSRWLMQDGDPATTIATALQATRWDDWTDVPGPIAESIREIGVRSSVGTPIVVEGRLWGALAVHTKQEAPFAPDTESRMAQFTKLVATAIADAEARTEVERLADEHAALRRVATLVAREASQDQIFKAIAEEIGRFADADEIRMLRYEADETVVVMAAAGVREEDILPVGRRLPLGGNNVTTRVWRTRAPARIETYSDAGGGPISQEVSPMGIRSVVATPILVEGRLWGAIAAGTLRDEPLPPDTESRISELTELMATAIANAESQTEVERLADQQAALRRVATLVAAGAPRDEIFTAVAGEIGNLFGIEEVRMVRFEEDSGMVVSSAGTSDRFSVGTRVSVDDGVAGRVRLTDGPSRIDDYETTGSPKAATVRAMGIRSVVAAPIRVQGELWGTITAGASRDEPLRPDAESRLGQFTDLIATAIANADSRDQLTASRARLVTEADEARRRVVRDLHDGAQQRLVHTIVTLKLAKRAFGEDGNEAEPLVNAALEQAERANEELRELAHGILPSPLTRAGLRAGVDAVVARLDLPVEVDVPAERFPAEIEASAYFIVAEALTNVVKHACAERAEVTAFVEEVTLHVEVRDDGIGGADPGGRGLVGLGDRATALGGLLRIETPVSGGTLVAATLPLARG